MTLSKKVLIIICATLIIMHFVLFYLSKNILLQAFIKIEKDDTIINLKRSIYLINETVRHLDKITLDWSSWDDTYAFIKEVNKDYIASNLVDGTFIDLDLNLMAFFNNSHEIVYGTGFDIDYEQKIPIPESLIRHISNKPLLLNHQAPSSFKKGIIMLPEGPLLVSSRPIITSEDRGPIRGTLIIGRYFDNNEISKLSNAMHVELNLVRIDSLSKLPGINLELFKSSDFYIRPLNERFIEGYALVKDIYYKPAFLLKITAIRAIYITGLENLNTIRTGLLIISILFTLFLILLLNKYVISMLTYLNFHVKTIIKTEDLSKRIPMKGKDELADLSYSFNEMLSTLENNQLSLRTSEERFKNFLNPRLM